MLLRLLARVFLFGCIISPPLTHAGLLGIGASPSTTAPTDIMSLYSIDTGTGASTLIGSTGIGGLQGLAASPLTGEIYSAGGSAAGPSTGLYRIDSATGAASFVGGTQYFVALDFAPDGTLFGIGALGTGQDDLYSIDLATGAATRVRFLGGFSNAGLAFSPDGTDIYYTWGGTQLSIFDSTTYDIEFTGPVGGVSVKRIATASDGTIYGASPPTSNRSANLHILNLGPPAQGTVVADIDISFQGLTFSDAQGGSNQVPAPATVALIGLGLLGLRLRRKA